MAAIQLSARPFVSNWITFTLPCLSGQLAIAEPAVRSTCICTRVSVLPYSTIVQCCPDYYYSYLYTTTLCQYCTSTTVRTSIRRTCTRLVYVRQSYSCSTCIHSVRTGTPDYHWIYRNSYLYTLSVPKSVPCSYPMRYTVQFVSLARIRTRARARCTRVRCTAVGVRPVRDGGYRISRTARAAVRRTIALHDTRTRPPSGGTYANRGG